MNGSGLPGVAKVLRRLSHAGQMLCLMAIDAIDQRQGFQHLERFARPGQKSLLVQPFLPFGTRRCACGDAAANAAAGLGAAHHHGSNGHIEGRGNAAAAIWPHHADGAAVDAPGLAFQLTDELHRPHLGRTGDRSAREQGSKHIWQPQATAGAGLHVRRHLPHGGQRLGVEQLGHPHRVRLGNA